MANSTLRAILSVLLIWGSSLLVPHHLYAQTSGWGTATLIGRTFVPKAQLPKIAMDPQGNAIAVWAQGNSTGVLSIWANRYDVESGSWGTPTLLETSSQDASETWVAMDNSGNAMAVWRQSDGVDPNPSIWANRYDVGSSSWGTATLIELNPGFASFPHVG